MSPKIQEILGNVISVNNHILDMLPSNKDVMPMIMIYVYIVLSKLINKKLFKNN